MSTAGDKAQYFLVIPAAGAGRRMQQQIPKQYQLVAGKPVLQHTLERLAAMQIFSRIVLAVAEQDERIHDLLRALPEAVSALVSVVKGGAERADSVLNALQSLAPLAGEQDWVMVHDAVRPCVAPADITRLLQALSAEPAGGLLAVPARDTVKLSSNNSHVSSTLDRTTVWLAATPQMFRFAILLQALQEQLSVSGGGERITDEAAAVEALGLPVRLVPCQHSNLKITYPEDLLLAETLLSAAQE